MRARRQIRSGRRRGLTLIEVLVAISLFSLLSVSILMALRVGAVAWEKTNSKLMLDRRIATANTILHAELEGIFPATAEFRRPPMPAASYFLFFQGQPGSMRFVTSYSLERGPRSGLRLVELQVVEGERGKRVLLNELPYDGPRSAGLLITNAIQEPGRGEARLTFAPILAQPSSFVIADELQGCSFSYLLQEAPDRGANWVPDWPRSNQLPLAVSIELLPNPDPARLLPVTVTAPIRANVRAL